MKGLLKKKTDAKPNHGNYSLKNLIFFETINIFETILHELKN